MTTTVTVTMRGDEWIAKAIPAMNRAVEAMALEGSLQAQAILKPAAVASSPWSPPHARHGAAGLRGRQNYTSPETAGTPLRAGFGTDLAYGRHLEFGAVIRPKKARMLVIPLNKEAHRLMVSVGHSGRAAIAAMQAKYTKGKRSGSRVVFVPSKKGGLLVMVQLYGRAPGKKASEFSGNIGAGSTPVFLLTRKAVIQPRPWLLRAALQGKEAIMGAGLARAGVELRKAGLVA